MSWDRCYDHPREKFERPPGGLRTLEDVWTEALALPIFMGCCWGGTVVEETGSFWTLPTVCWWLSAGFVCGSGGFLVGGWAAGLVGGGSLPKNIELPPPGGRRTLAISTQELTNNLIFTTVNFLFPLPGRVFPFPEPLVVHGVASCHDDGVTRVDSRTEESDEKKSVAYKPHFGSAPVCLWRQRSLHTAKRHWRSFP